MNRRISQLPLSPFAAIDGISSPVLQLARMFVEERAGCMTIVQHQRVCQLLDELEFILEDAGGDA